MVWAQVPDKQGNTYDSLISNFLTEIRRDQEDQRRLLEDLTRKIAWPNEALEYMGSQEYWQSDGAWEIVGSRE